MKNCQKPIDYARAACGTLMRRYATPALPPEGHFHYHQGAFLLMCTELHEAEQGGTK